MDNISGGTGMAGAMPRAPRRLEHPAGHPAATARPGAPAEPRSWLGRLLHRKEPTTFQRCLAVHIHFAGPHGGLH